MRLFGGGGDGDEIHRIFSGILLGNTNYWIKRTKRRLKTMNITSCSLSTLLHDDTQISNFISHIEFVFLYLCYLRSGISSSSLCDVCNLKGSKLIMSRSCDLMASMSCVCD